MLTFEPIYGARFDHDVGAGVKPAVEGRIMRSVSSLVDSTGRRRKTESPSAAKRNGGTLPRRATKSYRFSSRGGTTQILSRPLVGSVGLYLVLKGSTHSFEDLLVDPTRPPKFSQFGRRVIPRDRLLPRGLKQLTRNS